jgi:hypothetical protein
MHASLDRAAGRHVPKSVNLAWNGSVFGGPGEPITELYDFGMAELGKRHVRADFFWNAARDARKRGKGLAYTTYHNLGVPAYRKAIAGCYANGTVFLVPWDQYAGVGQARVFSRPEDLADLYGFVRANATLLEGYEDAAAVGPGLEDPRWKDLAPVRLAGGSGRISAFVRGKPGDRRAAVVVHLIEWGEPQPVRLGIRRTSFFGAQRDVQCELRQPVPYDAQAHAEAQQRAERQRENGARAGAEQADTYAALSRSSVLQSKRDGPWTWVRTPPLDPWAVLVVRAMD